MGLFRIANCNADNFNLPGVRYAGRAGTDGDPLPVDVYARKVAWLAGLFDTARPDLIGFEELFHKEAIAAVVGASRHLAGAHIYAPDLDSNVSDGQARGPFCGLVTRFPIVAGEAILAFPAEVKGKLRVQRSDASVDTIPVSIEQFQRPVLRVLVQLREDTVATVFVAHLKSKREQFLMGEDPDDPVAQALGNARSVIRRAAEAAALRALVVTAARGDANPLIVLGDLNDDLGSVTTRIIAGDHLPRAKRDERQAALDRDRLLYSVHDLQERASRRHVSYSHIHDGQYELLDHILVSEELVAESPRHIGRVRNTRMYNDHLFDSRLTSDRDERAITTSDHGVPVTEIEWADAVPETSPFGI